MSGNRDTLFCEDSIVLKQEHWPGEQYILRLQADNCAQNARAGQFVHLQCDHALPMRRPLSIMRVDADAGWIELLYKVVGQGTRLLSTRKTSDTLNLIGPVGNHFNPHPERPRHLLIGGGVGIPPMIFLANELWRHGLDLSALPLVLMGSESPFPFRLVKSRLDADGLPSGADTGLELLEDMGIPSRLASMQEQRGCHRGYVTELARSHLDAMTENERAGVQIYACGPVSMLKATRKLALDFGIPCQVSLEEFMACGVGGCAGCTASINTSEGTSMKRVCVDGPVFESAMVNF